MWAIAYNNSEAKHFKLADILLDYLLGINYEAEMGFNNEKL